MFTKEELIRQLEGLRITLKHINHAGYYASKAFDCRVKYIINHAGKFTHTLMLNYPTTGFIRTPNFFEKARYFIEQSITDVQDDFVADLDILHIEE